MLIVVLAGGIEFEANQEFMAKLSDRPEIQFAQSSFNTKYPQYEMDLNVPRAKELGVSLRSIFSVLQGYIGGVFAADFSRFGKQYRVYVQALPEDRADENNLNELYVRTESGQMTPITEFVSLKRVYGPQSVTRFNLFNSTRLMAATNPSDMNKRMAQRFILCTPCRHTDKLTENVISQPCNDSTPCIRANQGDTFNSPLVFAQEWADSASITTRNPTLLLR